MILILLSFAWILVVAVWWDLTRQIRRMDAALRASAYLDRVLPDPSQPAGQSWIESGTVNPLSVGLWPSLAPFNPEDVAWLHAAEGTGTYLAEADAVTILMGRATVSEEGE